MKIKVDWPEFCFKNDFPPESAKNLIFLEIDCHSIYFDIEKFPSENNLVSIQFIGSKQVIENSNFLEKFAFLTKLDSFYPRQFGFFEPIELKIDSKILKSIESS